MNKIEKKPALIEFCEAKKMERRDFVDSVLVDTDNMNAELTRFCKAKGIIPRYLGGSTYFIDFKQIETVGEYLQVLKHLEGTSIKNLEGFDRLPEDRKEKLINITGEISNLINDF